MTNPSLPIERWPQQDRYAWMAAIALPAFLEDGGPASHWRPATIVTNQHHYGRWLAFLQATGCSLSATDPADRCNEEGILKYVGHLRATVSSTTVTGSIVGPHHALKAMAPDRDWRWLGRIGTALKANQRPTRRKSSRIMPSGVVYVTALKEMKRLEGGLNSRSHSALRRDLPRYRDALIIAVAAALPLRRVNLSSLRVGSTIRKREDTWVVDFPGHRMKNHLPFSGELPMSLTPFLDTYVSEIRPVLLRGSTSDALWLSWYGKVLSDHTLYLRFIKTTGRIFGRPLNPHLMRDCAATTLADTSPDHALAAQELLGHKASHSTEANYIHAQQLDASRKVNALLNGRGASTARRKKS